MTDPARALNCVKLSGAQLRSAIQKLDRAEEAFPPGYWVEFARAEGVFPNHYAGQAITARIRALDDWLCQSRDNNWAESDLLFEVAASAKLRVTESSVECDLRSVSELLAFAFGVKAQVRRGLPSPHSIVDESRPIYPSQSSNMPTLANASL